MMKYRKKPIIIEAMPFDGHLGSVQMMHQIWGDDFKWAYSTAENYGEQVCLQIQTLEGWLHASPGDWIIRGIKGEFYPCKPNIFELTYEPVP